MKKILLFVSLVSIGFTCLAQSGTALPVTIVQPKNAKAMPAPKKNLTGAEVSDFTAATQPAMKHTPQPVSTFTVETIVGTSTYNLGTNSSVRNAVFRSSDNTVSAVFTYSNQASAFSDRGTGYNYYGGSWGAAPTARIETSRTGWPCIVTLNDNSEVGVCHNTALSKLEVFRRPVKGTGTWTEDTILGHPSGMMVTWPRFGAGGPDGKSLHVVGLLGGTTPTLYMGQTNPMVYSRSLDGGLTWPIENTILPVLDSNSYRGFNGDAYALDVRGNTIAILLGDMNYDVVLVKSTDNGITWTKTVISQFPIPFFNGDSISDVNGDAVADTITTCDGSVSVLVDNSDKVHAWWGVQRLFDDVPADASWSYFPATNGMMYWNETMSTPVMITGALDLNSNGQLDFDTTCTSTLPFGVYGTSLSSHPSAGIDSLNAIYLSYSAVVEGTNNGSCKSYRHQYIMRTEDGGATWTTPFDIFNDALSECVYGSIVREVTNPEGVCVLYYRDDAPGFGVGLGGEDDAANNGKSHDIVYACAPEILGIAENENSSIETVLYPNPASGNTTLEVISAGYSKATISIYNSVGEKVKTLSSKLAAGKNIVHLSLGGLSKGLYSITVASENTLTSSNLVIE